MTAERKLSILLSVYNGERHLRAAIDSILRQTYSDFEFLILDDGSTDGTASVLAEYAASDNRVVVLRNPHNQGITRAMNRLFVLARGQYVTRHDADDISLPERLAKQVSYLDQHPEIGVLATRVELMDADGRPIAEEPFFNTGYEHEDICQNLLAANCLCQGSVMVRRACLETVGYYDESLEQSEDYDLWLRLSEVTRLAKLPEALYRYRRHDQSITRRRYHQTAFDHARVLEKTMQRRYGAEQPASMQTTVIGQYLQAAVAKVEAAELAVARQCLERVMAHDSTYLVVNPDDLQPVLTALVDANRFGPAHEFGQAIFAMLPSSPPLTRMRARWLSRLHMREVFARAGQPGKASLKTHLWAGLRYDPSWLLNRGVVAIALRSLLAGP